MCINANPSVPVKANYTLLDFVKKFMYLGSLVRKNNAAQRDTGARLGKDAMLLQDFNPSGNPRDNAWGKRSGFKTA